MTFKNPFLSLYSKISILIFTLISFQVIAVEQEQKLTAINAQMTDLFGSSVSISGDRAVIGASQGHVNGDRIGTAYVFDFNGTTWVESARLTASNSGVSNAFGTSVSLSGNRIAVGSTSATDGVVANTGATYIFDYNNSTDDWEQTAILYASDKANGDSFGTNVSLDNNRVLIGAHRNDDNGSSSGSAYVFDYDGTQWVESIKLTASDAESGDQFGNKVDLENDRLIIAALFEDGAVTSSNYGAVYVFEYNGSTWQETQKLGASDNAVANNFGRDISLSGNRIIVGTPNDGIIASQAGAAYIFDYNVNNNMWTESVKLTAADAVTKDYFGYSVSIDGNKALVGAWGNDDNGASSGSAYSFYYNGSSWIQTGLILHDDSTVLTNDQFGFTLNLDGGKALISAYKDDANQASSAYDSGAVYVFDVDEKPVAVLDNITINEDATHATIDVLNNDTDVDGGLKIITEVNQPTNGVVTIVSNDTQIKYVPNANYCNDGSTTDDFSYTLNGGSSTSVEVTVNCIDDPAVAFDDTKTVNEDSNGVVIDVLSNDTDIDGGVMTIASISQPNNGTVTNNSNSLSYEPDSNYCSTGNNTDDFTYELNTGSSASVSVTVNCVDDAPIAVIDERMFNEDQTSSNLLVLENDTDIDDGPMTITNFTQPNNGTVALVNNDLSYAPSLDYCNNGNTTDNFTYTLNNNSTTSVNVTVNCVNDAPSFDIIGDIDLEISELNNQNQLIITNFTNNIMMGPSNESSQQVLQYHINESSDSDNVVNSLSIDNNGTLTIEFSTNPGVAIAGLSLQDNGGVANNGQDTSGIINFNISYPDGIFENGFEAATVLRVPELLNKLSLELNLFEIPQYDYQTHSVLYGGFMLELQLADEIDTLRVKQWILEIESYLSNALNQ